MLETFPERTKRVDPNIREDESRNLPHDYRMIKVKGLDICQPRRPPSSTSVCRCPRVSIAS